MDDWLFGERPKDMLGLHSYWENCYNEKDDDINKYDVQMTFYQSFARQITKRLSVQFNSLVSPIWKAKEAHYYMHKDRLDGVLVKFDVKIVGYNGKKELAVFETWAKKINSSVLFNRNMSEPGNRLKGLEVCMFYLYLWITRGNV